MNEHADLVTAAAVRHWNLIIGEPLDGGTRPSRYPFPEARTTYADAERVAREHIGFERRDRGEPTRAQAGLDRQPAAAAATEELITTAPEAVLLHGDLINKNLITDDASPTGYLAIDPLPHIGDPASEVGRFASSQPAKMILTTAESLSDQLGLDRQRSMRWTAIWLVHQTVQAWREDQEELDDLTGSAAIGCLLDC